MDPRGGGGDFEHALCFGRIPADQPRRPRVCAGPSGTAAGISALAGERVEAGADAGCGFDCGGQLHHRWNQHCGPGVAGGCAEPAHVAGGKRARGDARPDGRLQRTGVEADAGTRSHLQRGRGDVCRRGTRDPAGRVRTVHSRHHGAGPGGTAAAPGTGGEAEPGVRPGVDGAGPRGLQPAAVHGGGRGFCEGGPWRRGRA